MTLHLDITQDIGHGVTIIFICCAVIVVSVLLDLNTGLNAARKNKERICSRFLRRTITKMLDYMRILLFGVMIDVLGLAFPWYDVPYCAILVALGCLLIEAKSVLENYEKSQSAARELPDFIAEIISCDDEHKAAQLLKLIKGKGKKNE